MRTKAVVSLLLVGALTPIGCGKSDRPTSIPNDADLRDFPPVDSPSSTDAADDRAAPTDGASMDATDGAATDASGTDATMSTDGSGTTDRPGDVPADVFVSPLCGFTESQINRLAVRIAGCTGEPAQTVLDRYWRPDTWEGNGVQARDCLALRCAASATDCSTAMFDCLKYGVTRLGDAGVCTPTPTCEGDGRRILTRCDGVRRFADDCEATARTCVATTTEAACAPAMAEMCSPGAAPRCAGTDFQQCVAGRYVTVQRCGATQSLCDAAAGGCVGTGAMCPGTETSCNGTSLALCRNGRTQSLTCSNLVMGSSCRVVAGHAFCGAAADCDPTSAAPGGRCDGNNLLLCAGGRMFTYDCRAEGFAGCGTNGCTP